VRSALHENVIVAAMSLDPMKRQHAVLQIEHLHKTLVKWLPQLLNIKELLRLSRTSRAIHFSQVANGTESGKRPLSTRGEEHLLKAMLEVNFDANPDVGISQEKRAKATRAFATVVRNSCWLPTLTQLGLSLAVATEEHEYLLANRGSHQGKALIEEALKVLCPGYSVVPAKVGTAKLKVKAKALYEVQVVFTSEKLLAQPDIAALATMMPPATAYKTVMPVLGDLMRDATQPVKVAAGDEPEEVAQAILDKLLTGLHERKKAIEAELRKAKTEAQKKVKAEAVQALKGLSPKLLKALKENPDLLNEL